MGAKRSGIGTMIGVLWGVSLTGTVTGGAHAMASEAPPAKQCIQLGGKLLCRMPDTSDWTYQADNRQFPDEASVYGYMMERYGASAIFSLAYRWTKGDAAQWPTKLVHSIESASWKVFQVCVRDMPSGYCDTHPNFRGYQRIRKVECPAGYRFSADTDSPYCMPNLAAPEANQTASTAGHR